MEAGAGMTSARNTAHKFKAMSKDALLDFFDGVPFVTEPRHHQLASIAWALDNDRDRVVFWHDIGTGKTWTALWAAYLYGARRTLVVCPNSVVRGWAEQISQHTRKSHILLRGPQQQRQMLSQCSQAAFHVINYEGLKALWGRRVQVPGTDKSKWAVDNDRIVQSFDYDCVIFDEAHHLSNGKSLQSDIAFSISKLCKNVVMLTGSPTANSEVDLWYQYYVLDQGRTLGDNQFAFRARYFRKYGYDWKIKGERARRELMDRISAVTMRYEASECVDLPELTIERLDTEMPDSHRKLYDDALAVAKIELSKDEVVNLTTVTQRAAKLLQIISGFVITEDGPQRLPGHSGKAEALLDLLPDIRDRKFLVCHCFKEEGRIIEELLEKAKVKYVSLRGEIPDKQKERNYLAFKDDPTVKALVFHPRSAGEGLNLQIADRTVFWSFGFLGSIMRKQVIGRTHRAGQMNPCVVFDLVTPGSAESAIYSGLGRKVEAAQALLDYIRGAVSAKS